MSLFATNSGAFIKWDEPKTITGGINGFRMGTDVNDNPAVVIDIGDDSGVEVSITVAQANLQRGFAETFGDPHNIAELDPFVGGGVAVALTGTEKVAGGETLKLLAVELKAAAEAVAAAPAWMV